jgi:hypothetical protein
MYISLYQQVFQSCDRLWALWGTWAGGCMQLVVISILRSAVLHPVDFEVLAYMTHPVWCPGGSSAAAAPPDRALHLTMTIL